MVERPRCFELPVLTNARRKSMQVLDWDRCKTKTLDQVGITIVFGLLLITLSGEK